MSKALSMDLWECGLDAIAAETSCREAATRFGVSAARAIRCRQRQKTQGSARPGPLGGNHQSQHVEGRAEMILSLLEAQLDATPAELRATLPSGAGRPVPRDCGASSSIAGSCSKKSTHADEQNRPDILTRRQAWFDGQIDLDPEQLMFINETGTSTKMGRASIEAAGARLLLFPPYNPDFNLIDDAFGKLKHLMRKV